MKITKYMGAFAVIAMLAACSTDDEQSANTAANEVKIAATVVETAFLPVAIHWVQKRNKKALMRTMPSA